MLVLATLLLLAGCRDGTGVDDGGDVPSSVSITVATSPVIGDTLRVTAVARNRGGRALPGIQPALTFRIGGRAAELLSSTVAVAVDTGRVTITAGNGTVTGEQVVTVGMPSSLDLDFVAPDSVRMGDSIPPLRLEVRRDGVVRRDLLPEVTSSDTAALEVRQSGPLTEYRPIRPGNVTLTARLGSRAVARTIRVRAARIGSFAFAPVPTVLDPGDIAELSLAAFDVQGATVDTSEMTFTVLDGPGVIVGRGQLRATAPGRIVVRAEARGEVRVDTVDVMPPSSFTLTVRPGFDMAGVPSVIPPRLQVAIDRAVKRWRQVIREDLPPVPLQLARGPCRNPDIDEVVSGVLTYVRVLPLGINGPLAQATACVLRSDGRSLTGFMEFNSDVIDRQSSEALFYIAAHEIGHMLGIGTVWYRPDGQPSLVVSQFPRIFIGPQAVAQFNLLANRSTYTGPVVPLSSDGGHWAQNVLMLELMEPFARATTRFSRVTVGAMADMGFVVNDRSWDRYALSLPALRFPPLEPPADLSNDVLPPFGVVRPDGRVIPFR